MLTLSRREQMIVLVFSVVLLAMGGFFWHQLNRYAPPPPTAVQGEGDEPPPAEQGVEIVVHVAGAVKHPNVYRLPKGARVFEAVEAAGGALDNADLNSVNLADYVQDATQIFIPFLPVDNSAASAGYPAAPPAPADGKININTAGESEIDTLPGIGPAKARAIIQYRTENGPFQTVDDLEKVPGIGPKTLEDIRDKVKVR